MEGCQEKEAGRYAGTRGKRSRREMEPGTNDDDESKGRKTKDDREGGAKDGRRQRSTR